MIQVKATKHLTGVTIQGDYHDFNELLEALYRMTGSREESDLFDGVRNRLLALAYDVRHALQGDYEMVLKENTMFPDLKEEMGIKNCDQNVYLSFNMYFPEALFFSVCDKRNICLF